jgi:hypothetical protein
MAEGLEKGGAGEVYSKAVRAGKRTYFFDVKSTRSNDLFLTITESRKYFNEKGAPAYQKHKIFLYKEDFEKFEEGLKETLAKIQQMKEQGFESYTEDDSLSEFEKKVDDINFEDL